MVKVYTRGGDKGLTSLADGQRVSKANPRLDCYGSVDELNSNMGLIAVMAADDRLLKSDKRQQLRQWIASIQNDLFRLGSDLATPQNGRWDGQRLIDADDVTALEKLIDHCTNALPPLKHFVLPGATALNAELHRARTICRRAERLVSAQQAELQLNPETLRYLNRLSDLLFTLARWQVHQVGATEQSWDQDQSLAALLANKGD